jgi:hypothetical protein
MWIKGGIMLLTIQTVVDGLINQGYREVGGSDVFRILRHPITCVEIKVYYNDYVEQDIIIIREI